MQFIKSIIVAAAALAAVQAHAYTYTFSDPIPAGSYSAPVYTNSFQASTETTSVPNVYLQPQGVTGSFLVVTPQPSGTAGHATIELGGVSSYSFVWGSPDAGNSIEIFSDKTNFTTYTGTDLMTQFKMPMSGDGMNGNTGLFTISGGTIDHLVLSSTNVAFEVAAPVPEPETYALMLAGLGALGFIARRRKAA